MSEKKSKIIYWIMLLITIIGIIVIALKGFNVELKYTDTQRIELLMDKKYNFKEVEQIAKEVLGKKVIVQEVELYNDIVLITSNEITDDQKNQIIDKVNEKYEIEIAKDSVEIVNVPRVKIREVVIPYIVPLIIVSIIFIAYLGVVYHQKGIVQTVLKPIIKIVLSQSTLFGILAITRIPLGRFVPTYVLLVYILSLGWVIKEITKEDKE